MRAAIFGTVGLRLVSGRFRILAKAPRRIEKLTLASLYSVNAKGVPNVKIKGLVFRQVECEQECTRHELCIMNRTSKSKTQA